MRLPKSFEGELLNPDSFAETEDILMCDLHPDKICNYCGRC